MKQIAREAFRQALESIDIPSAMERLLARSGHIIAFENQTIDLREFPSILAVAFGKAAYSMARGLTDILSPEYTPEGILVAPVADARGLPGWKIFQGGHPTPNAASFQAGRAILASLAKCDDKTLIFFLLSGGGSALVEHPLYDETTLEDFQALHSLLVSCGASIGEINSIRKHLSATKGGRLAVAAPRSMKLTIAISDVPHGQESTIASGPTLPDPTTSLDACRTARDYGLLAKLPASIRDIFENGSLRENPKPGQAVFGRNYFCLLMSEHDLLHAAHHACEAHGFQCIGDATTDNWSVEKAADHLLSLLQRQCDERSGANSRRPVAVIATGELSSPVTGNGIGGRNSAFVLACVPQIAGKQITVLSAGTDGIDGNSPAAGAVADGSTLGRAEAAGIGARDYFARSDAHSFFAQLGDAIVTGPTGTNLRDLRILLAR